MLRRRSSISFTNTSKVKERHFKLIIQNFLKSGKYIGILLITVLLFFVSSKLLVINQVICSTNEGQCPPEMENLLLHIKGKSLFSIDKKLVKETVSNVFPIGDIRYKFLFPNKLSLQITGWQPSVPIQIYQTSSLPFLSIDISSSDSAIWTKPSIEASSFLADKELKGQKLWSVGRMTPEKVDESNIKQVFVENPTEDTLSEFFSIIKLANKYLANPKIIMIGPRILLSQDAQPDIIINIPADMGDVESALQSIDYLYTINKDAKVIDLSFKHPIIK